MSTGIIDLGIVRQSPFDKSRLTTVKKCTNEMDYADVFENYIFSNTPFILLIDRCGWSCYDDWISDGKPNFDYLENAFGSTEVPVANCGLKYFNSQEKECLLLSDYMDYWKDFIAKSYPDSMKLLYLKDWHFTRDFADQIYKVPKFFSSDWLNEYFVSRADLNDDYKFVYMGPKGTWTPFHADVFTSFSWSANICGRKKWRLFPPGEEKCLRDKFGSLVYDVESGDLNDSARYPDYHGLEDSYELIQEPGEAIFVPSGWHHQVWNLEDTISVNHNWINGCNAGAMWLAMKKALAGVKAEIADCASMDGWTEHCQVMLKATFGMDYATFCDFLAYIAARRIGAVNAKVDLVVGSWRFGEKHLLFDLLKIEEILSDVTEDGDLKLSERFQLKRNEISDLVNEIRIILRQYDLLDVT